MKGFQHLIYDVPLGGVQLHKDATNTIFFRIKPATLSTAHELRRGIDAKGRERYVQPELFTRGGVDFTGKFELEAPQANIEKDSALYFERKVLKLTELNQSVGGVTLAPGNRNLFVVE